MQAYLNWQLPYGIGLSTDVSIISYDGNSDPSLNKTVTMWNATLCKGLFKDKVLVSLTVHDILADANAFNSSIDAVSRTETNTNVIPRFVKLSLFYYFNWTAKKKSSQP